ncbi:hypothetical protein HYH03_013260 [Edaphochlamys debaryana]|uniref:Protein kinase domain-containing protein n=1 Tax=Edaphochlamys debaryana TaxID=47281 RepID=A0A836BT27_9CHLO|nr:hypothetical protein HYH03_013260 [Edaphochlamys debaryana]|eukprot:KAG2488111.1 hypothetical protein HYH03_013260 [Edaphochlamys debaryana]
MESRLLSMAQAGDGAHCDGGEASGKLQLAAGTTFKLKLGRVVGKGSFAVVHKALLDGRIVAVKVLRPEFVSHRTVVRMLLREANLLSSVSHPHVVKCHTLCQVPSGPSGSTYALVLEYMEGGTLAHLISKQMTQPRALLYSDVEGLTWLLQIADALAFLHRQDPMVIHRDVKPANVLLGRDSEPLGGTPTGASPGGMGAVASSGIGVGVGGGGGGPTAVGPRGALVAKLCDLGLHQAVRAFTSRPMLRVSGAVARAVHSGVFHTPRVSDDGGLLLPPALLDAVAASSARGAPYGGPYGSLYGTAARGADSSGGAVSSGGARGIASGRLLQGDYAATAAAGGAASSRLAHSLSGPVGPSTGPAVHDAGPQSGGPSSASQAQAQAQAQAAAAAAVAAIAAAYGSAAAASGAAASRAASSMPAHATPSSSTSFKHVSASHLAATQRQHQQQQQQQQHSEPHQIATGREQHTSHAPLRLHSGDVGCPSQPQEALQPVSQALQLSGAFLRRSLREAASPRGPPLRPLQMAALQSRASGRLPAVPPTPTGGVTGDASVEASSPRPGSGGGGHGVAEDGASPGPSSACPSPRPSSPGGGSTLSSRPSGGAAAAGLTSGPEARQRPSGGAGGGGGSPAVLRNPQLALLARTAGVGSGSGSGSASGGQIPTAAVGSPLPPTPQSQISSTAPAPVTVRSLASPAASASAFTSPLAVLTGWLQRRTVAREVNRQSSSGGGGGRETRSYPASAAHSRTAPTAAAPSSSDLPLTAPRGPAITLTAAPMPRVTGLGAVVETDAEAAGGDVGLSLPGSPAGAGMGSGAGGGGGGGGRSGARPMAISSPLPPGRGLPSKIQIQRAYATEGGPPSDRFATTSLPSLPQHRLSWGSACNLPHPLASPLPPPKAEPLASASANRQRLAAASMAAAGSALAGAKTAPAFRISALGNARDGPSSAGSPPQGTPPAMTPAADRSVEGLGSRLRSKSFAVGPGAGDGARGGVDGGGGAGQQPAARPADVEAEAGAERAVAGGGGRTPPPLSPAVPSVIGPASTAGTELPGIEQVFPLSGQCGSSIYMSPEVAQEQPYNDKADVFSFGVMCYEVMCRTLISRTHAGRDGFAFTRHLVEGQRPSLPPDLDPRIAGLIEACWLGDPVERPTMAQVFSSLEYILYGAARPVMNDDCARGSSSVLSPQRYVMGTGSASGQQGPPTSVLSPVGRLVSPSVASSAAGGGAAATAIAANSECGGYPSGRSPPAPYVPRGTSLPGTGPILGAPQQQSQASCSGIESRSTSTSTQPPNPPARLLSIMTNTTASMNAMAVAAASTATASNTTAAVSRNVSGSGGSAVWVAAQLKQQQAQQAFNQLLRQRSGNVRPPPPSWGMSVSPPPPVHRPGHVPPVAQPVPSGGAAVPASTAPQRFGRSSQPSPYAMSRRTRAHHLMDGRASREPQLMDIAAELSEGGGTAEATAVANDDLSFSTCPGGATSTLLRHLVDMPEAEAAPASAPTANAAPTVAINARTGTGRFTGQETSARSGAAVSPSAQAQAPHRLQPHSLAGAVSHGEASGSPRSPERASRARAGSEERRRSEQPVCCVIS